MIGRNWFRAIGWQTSHRIPSPSDFPKEPWRAPTHIPVYLEKAEQSRTGSRPKITIEPQAFAYLPSCTRSAEPKHNGSVRGFMHLARRAQLPRAYMAIRSVRGVKPFGWEHSTVQSDLGCACRTGRVTSSRALTWYPVHVRSLLLRSFPVAAIRSPSTAWPRTRVCAYLPHRNRLSEPDTDLLCGCAGPRPQFRYGVQG
jgi:hypothetical protein